MPFKETDAVYYENRTKPIRTQRGRMVRQVMHKVESKDKNIPVQAVLREVKASIFRH
jgi:hypothetical protein